MCNFTTFCDRKGYPILFNSKNFLSPSFFYCMHACTVLRCPIVMVVCLSDGVSSWSSLMVISITGVLLYAKVSPFIMYYGSALLLFTRKVHCLQTFEYMSAHRAIKV